MKETSEIPLKHGKLLTTIMTIVTLVYVCPIFIVLMNSFKANTFVKTDTFAWPTGEAVSRLGKLYQRFYIWKLSVF